MVDETPAQKLAELLESAPSDDRRAITAWLLERRPEPPVGPLPADLIGRIEGVPVGPLRRLGKAMVHDPLAGTGEWLSPEHLQRLRAMLTTSGPRGALTPGGESQLVTLRLPAERHAELRRWCTEHDFSMAAVIRGLVEQFLEDRGGPPEGSAEGSAGPAGPADA
jgi:hypothetical protein